MFASPLEALVARTGSSDHDPDWVDAVFAESLAYVRLLAPCKRSVWLDWATLPDDVRAVVTSAMSRMAMNPRGIRQETIGEYSYTIAGQSPVDGGFFTGYEARIIGAIAGCGGGIRTVPVSLELPLNLDAPEVSENFSGGGYKPPGTHWQEPSHDNGWVGRWL